MAEDYEATVALAIAQSGEDWDWATCIVCGAAATMRGLVLLRSTGTVGRIGWCHELPCQADQEQTPAFVLPDANADEVPS